ncbi:hypothetical protein [Clostridium tertium]|uniref:hypothetical protein n=1 Tax=Clostridium tertium TaxID=1559 RepID=UPI000BE291AF|nr:hypothetical protein [Clostridium tertium]
MKEMCGLSLGDINEAKYACLKMFIFRLGYDCREIKLDNGTIVYSFFEKESNMELCRFAIRSSFEIHTDLFEKEIHFKK